MPADATYQVMDSGSEVYGNENPRLCPTKYTDDNPVTSATLTSGSAAWVYPAGMSETTDIWGFRVNIEVKDREGETWGPVDNWNPVYVRTYTGSDDGFASMSGVVCGSQTCTITFSGFTATAPTPVYGFEGSHARLSVYTVNLDGVESSAVVSAELAL